MPFNLLIIPLLGGYIFVRFWNFTKISMLRADKDRMLIRASLAGLGSLVLAFPLSIYLPQWIPALSGITSWWAANIPFDFMGVSFIAFAISATGWWPMNWFCSIDEQIDRAIVEDADPLEIAFKESQDFELPLAFTLASGKVYIGIVTHQFNPATPTNNVGIVPLQSGHRDPDSKRFNLTNNYAVIIRGMRNRIDQIGSEIDEKTKDLVGKAEDEAIEIARGILELQQQWEDLESRIDLFEVIIPVDQITTVFFFDERTYAEYFQSGLSDESSLLIN